jgi:hypothetical protein
MRGPERSRPASRGPEPSSAPGRGGAYSAPPGAPGSAGPSRGPGRRPWLVAGVVVAVLAGGFLYRGGLGGAPSQAPAVEQTTAAAPQVLLLGTADVDQPATDLAKALIAQGTLPAPPPSVAPASAPASTAAQPSPAPATATPSAPTAAPVTAAPTPAAPRPAAVVHRAKPAPSAPKAAAPLPAPAAETQQAVRQLLADAPAETRASIAGGNTVIYSLHILDDVVEDGDVVEIFVNGTSYGQVTLSSGGQDVLIPLPVGTTAKVHALAVQDGGGGVTFGVTTSQGEIRSTVMAVGQSDDWSVTIQ